jgi:hypothetical protein
MHDEDKQYPDHATKDDIGDPLAGRNCGFAENHERDGNIGTTSAEADDVTTKVHEREKRNKRDRRIDNLIVWQQAADGNAGGDADDRADRAVTQLEPGAGDVAGASNVDQTKPFTLSGLDSLSVADRSD